MIITVYHSQFDDQSEHTNQTAEIVLQYALERTLNANFINFLSEFRKASCRNSAARGWPQIYILTRPQSRTGMGANCHASVVVPVIWLF